MSESLSDRVNDIISRMTDNEKQWALSSKSKGLPSIGLPPYNWGSEAAHGICNVRNDDVTPFQSNFALPLTLAQSFNKSLWYATGLQIGIEARAFMNLGNAYSTYWAPVVNIIRDPRWGRNLESPGEDPYAVGEYAVNFVKGLQENPGDPTHLQASACCKHFVANDLDNWGGKSRYNYDAKVSMRDLRDSYFPPFKACVEKAHVTGLMCSYNSVNGVPACADSWLLQEVARNQWGFSGYITSDCDAVKDIFTSHHYTKTEGEAVAAAILAGTDIDCGDFFDNHLQTALDSGFLTYADIEKSLRRSFAVRMRLGHFDSPTFLQTLGKNDICSPKARELVRDGGRQGAVLLKNINSTLPLNPSKKVLIVGPTADLSRMYAPYYGGIPCDARYISVEDSLREHARDVSVERGLPSVSTLDENVLDAAVRASESAEVIVLALGQDRTIEIEGKDRASIDLTEAQKQLYQAIASHNPSKPIVVLIFSGGAVDISLLLHDHRIGAILFVGQTGGTSALGLGDILYGLYSPAGRMTQTTYPASFVDEVSMFDQGMRPGKSLYPPKYRNPGRTYRFYTGKPVLPFGFGLSYTTFRYTYTNDRITVQNTGKVDSDHVVLVFVVPPNAGKQGMPLRKLVMFERVFVPAGQSRIVYMDVSWSEHFSFVSEEGELEEVFGVHTIELGVEGLSEYTKFSRLHERETISERT